MQCGLPIRMTFKGDFQLPPVAIYEEAQFDPHVTLNII